MPASYVTSWDGGWWGVLGAGSQQRTFRGTHGAVLGWLACRCPLGSMLGEHLGSGPGCRYPHGAVQGGGHSAHHPPPLPPDLRIPLMWKDTEYFRNKGGEWGVQGGVAEPPFAPPSPDSPLPQSCTAALCSACCSWGPRSMTPPWCWWTGPSPTSASRALSSCEWGLTWWEGHLPWTPLGSLLPSSTSSLLCLIHGDLLPVPGVAPVLPCLVLGGTLPSSGPLSSPDSTGTPPHP